MTLDQVLNHSVTQIIELHKARVRVTQRAIAMLLPGIGAAVSLPYTKEGQPPALAGVVEQLLNESYGG